MKVVVIGTRGIPEIQGGVETHCQQLYPRIAALGHDVTVVRRTPYIGDSRGLAQYKGVKLADVYAPRKKSLEAIVHTALAVFKARSLNPDILHVHAIGPGIMVPLARLLGMKVVATNHGPDYDRQKWGSLAKFVLRTGERLSARFSHKVIVISQVIADILKNNCGRADTELVYNGVETPQLSSDTSYIKSLGLAPGRYVVAIGRFVREKGFHDLIDAFSRLSPNGYKLAIAGDADHEDDYSRRLKQMAKEKGVVLTGFIRGEKMNQLMGSAALFCMPSYHEGLPIALLEAMSYGLDVAVSSIPANHIKELSEDDFFPVGDVDALAELIKRKLGSGEMQRTYDLSAYDWDNIARQTVAVYEKVLKG